MKKSCIILLFFVTTFLFVSKYSVAEVYKDSSAQEPISDINLSNYMLGPGDKVEIKVYRNDDLNFTLMIDPSGKISYPLLGDLQAAGLTVFELRDFITKGLSKFFNNPQVMVTLTAYQSNRITVLGGVTSPGVIPLDRQLRILEIVSRSGGFTSSSDKSNVIVIRKLQTGSTVLNLNLKKALQGDKTQDIMLMKDDIVYVPPDTNKLIVLGEVKNPGPVALDREYSESAMLLLDVIAKVGGFGSDADKTKVVIIRKDGELKRFNLKKVVDEGDFSQNAIVQKGDIVFVPKSEQKIIVMGEVNNPSSFVFETPITLLELLSKTGGFTSSANRNNVLLIRNDNNAPQLIAFDLQRILESGDLSQNLVLQNGDIIYIPKDNKRVIVLGEVKNPGYYSYTEPLTLMDVIGKSSGLSANADETKIIVLRKGVIKKINIHEIKEGDFEQNITLQNGDIVYVPTTFIADVEAVLVHITNVFSTFSAILSPISLFESIKSNNTSGSTVIVQPSN